MKHTFILLSLLISFGMVALNAQTKKEIQDHNNLLKQQLEFMKSQNDSLKQKNRLSDYFINHFQKTYLPVGSDQSLAYTQYYLDSLLNSSSKAELPDSLIILKDSLHLYQNSNDSLRFENQLFRDILGILIDQKNYPQSENDFIGKWHFIINPITIKKDSLYSGLVTYSRINLASDIHEGMIESITLMEDELANIEYYDGSNEKCFYNVKNFSKTDTYSIHFERKDKIDLHLVVTHLPNGIQISYQSKNTKFKNLFYLGYMKR